MKFSGLIGRGLQAIRSAFDFNSASAGEEAVSPMVPSSSKDFPAPPDVERPYQPRYVSPADLLPPPDMEAQRAASGMSGPYAKERKPSGDYGFKL